MASGWRPVVATAAPRRRDGRAVLLDVDGVLLDSMDAYQRAWAKWSLACGLDPDRVLELTPGRRPSDTIRAVAPDLDVSEEHRHLVRILASEVAQVRAMPGAHELLRALPPARWALVTSNTEAVVRRCFAHLGLTDPVLVVDAEAVTAGKPHPEGYLLAAMALGAQPRDCLVVEDAPAGVEAARAAGMFVYAVNSNGARTLLRAADRIYESLAEAAPAVLGWAAQDDVSNDQSNRTHSR